MAQPAKKLSAQKEWNLLLTTFNHHHDHLMNYLKKHGDFWWTEFRDVAMGHVPQVPKFIREFQADTQKDSTLQHLISRLVPIDESFEFQKATFLADLKKRILRYADMVKDASYYIRFERRGHGDDLRRPEVELKVGDALWDHLKGKGLKPVVSFADPDYILVIELVGDQCGLGHIDRSQLKTYSFIRPL
jgi:tRNA(Ser,Leu) C12 N-acetylase TAN1